MPEGYSGEAAATRELKKSKKKEDTGIAYSYRLLLSWLIEDPSLFAPVSDRVSPEDFYEENFHTVAVLLYEQLAAGELVPARIINHFQDVESQKLVAQMFQTDFQTEMSLEEKEKALNELVVRIKEYSIDYRIRNLSAMEELQSLILEKKRWQTPEKLHISLKDG